MDYLSLELFTIQHINHLRLGTEDGIEWALKKCGFSILVSLLLIRTSH